MAAPTPKTDEYEKLRKQFSKTTMGKLSDYSRKSLLGKPITTTYRNQYLDDFMAEMIVLRNELNSLGNNFNQAIKKFHTLQQIAEFRTWILTYETQGKLLLNILEEIKTYIQNIGEKWLH